MPMMIIKTEIIIIPIAEIYRCDFIEAKLLSFNSFQKSLALFFFDFEKSIFPLMPSIMFILEIFFAGDLIASATMIKETKIIDKLNKGLNFITSKALTPSPIVMFLYKQYIKKNPAMCPKSIGIAVIISPSFRSKR